MLCLNKKTVFRFSIYNFNLLFCHSNFKYKKDGNLVLARIKTLILETNADNSVYPNATEGDILYRKRIELQVINIKFVRPTFRREYLKRDFVKSIPIFFRALIC